MKCYIVDAFTKEGLTLSPRQRVAAFREIERLKASGEEPHRAAEMQKLFRYAGEQTCATDSLCNLHCPVGADAGKLIKEFRHESHTPRGEKRAVWLATHMAGVTSVLRGFLKWPAGPMPLSTSMNITTPEAIPAMERFALPAAKTTRTS